MDLKDIHPNPWLCPNWLKHYAAHCDCEKIRKESLAKPNLGMESEEAAKALMVPSLNQLIKHTLFGPVVGYSHLKFIRTFLVGQTANLWLHRAILDAIMDYCREIHEKLDKRINMNTLQPAGWNLAPDYFFPIASDLFTLAKTPVAILRKFDSDDVLKHVFGPDIFDKFKVDIVA